MTPCRASAPLTAGLFLLASALAACSRSGTLSGDIFVQTPPEEVVSRAARISVRAIPSTEAFERDWTAALAAFQAEVEPARKAQQAAAASLEEARLAWDRNLAAGRMAGTGASRRHRGPRTSARDRQLWEQLRAAERVLFQAKLRVWEVAHNHDGQADTLLAKHTAQRVQTDADGHYVLVGLPTGKAILYTRVPMRDQMLVWFVPVLVRSGMQRVDLTEANRGGWPFVP
jgi:hypothetical protein